MFYQTVESQAVAFGLLWQLACERGLFAPRPAVDRLSPFRFFPARVALPLRFSVEHRVLCRMLLWILRVLLSSIQATKN